MQSGEQSVTRVSKHNLFLSVNTAHFLARRDRKQNPLFVNAQEYLSLGLIQ